MYYFFHIALGPFCVPKILFTKGPRSKFIDKGQQTKDLGLMVLSVQFWRTRSPDWHAPKWGKLSVWPTVSPLGLSLFFTLSNTCIPCSFPLVLHNARSISQEDVPTHDDFEARRISFPSLALARAYIRLPKSFLFSYFCSFFHYVSISHFIGGYWG